MQKDGGGKWYGWSTVISLLHRWYVERVLPQQKHFEKLLIKGNGYPVGLDKKP